MTDRDRKISLARMGRVYDGGRLTTVDAPSTAEQRARARRACFMHGRDADERETFLDMLGLKVA